MGTTELPVTKKLSHESVTPHKITIAILIRRHCLFRDTDDFKCIQDEELKVRYRRDFCVLILKLLQSPDLSLEELRNILTSNKYEVLHQVIESFDSDLEEMYLSGTGAMVDTIEKMNHIMPMVESINGSANDVSESACISRTSIVGFYLRRVIVNFDVLTFSEVTGLFLKFQKYYETWDIGLKCQNSESSTKIFAPDDWSANRDQWSRRQAELFIATQAMLISSNPEKALAPPEIHSRITDLLKSNPKLAQAHFLSYLNYMRVGEFYAAMESLYHCFDRKTVPESKGTTTEEKSQIYRFATLNLAILHYHFGHREEALACLKQAISTSQAASDDVCLEHSLSWLYKLTGKNKEQLIEQLVSTSYKMEMSNIGSLGVQTFVQHACTISGNPVKMFENLTKSDIVNSHNNMFDLISNSFSVRSALWQYYGKSEMSLLWSQLSLFLNIDNQSFNFNKKFNSEGVCLAICKVANHLLQLGDYSMVSTILEFAKVRFPDEPNSNQWKMCENLAVFVQSLHHENYHDAESAAQKILVLDQCEGHLRLAELYFYKQDYAEAHRYLDLVLERHEENNEDQLKMIYYVRAKILMAEIQFTTTDKVPPPGILTLLNDCLITADKYYLEYYAALARLHIANIQLRLGLTEKTYRTFNKCLIQVLAHGGYFDRARAMLLYVKCKLAHSETYEGEERRCEILSCSEILEKTKEYFKKVEAFSRVKDVLYLQLGTFLAVNVNGIVPSYGLASLAKTHHFYLVNCLVNVNFQAHLFNMLNMKPERNRCALECRLMEEEKETKNYCTLSRYL